VAVKAGAPHPHTADMLGINQDELEMHHSLPHGAFPGKFDAAGWFYGYKQPQDFSIPVNGEAKRRAEEGARHAARRLQRGRRACDNVRRCEPATPHASTRGAPAPRRGMRAQRVAQLRIGRKAGRAGEA
jgi:hypothetical protein